MEILQTYFPNFFDVFRFAFLFIVRGGWVIFVIGMVYMLWRLYYIEIVGQYLKKQNWIFIQIKVPKENMVSTLAVENIFSQLHSLHVGKTFAEKYIEGHIQLWYSLELVSLGGKISYIIRLPERMRHNIEAAIYAQYPTAEISEIEDYMKNFDFHPTHPHGIDIFGTEWILTQDDVIPIKTYKDFEHPAAEQKIIDPLAGLFEGLAKFGPQEFFGVQIIIQPLSDEEWKPRGERKIKELTGEEVPHEPKFSDVLLAPLHWFAAFSYKKAILPSHDHHGENENKPRNNWLNMTEAEKNRVTLVEGKIGKQGYKTKMRFLYIAPVEVFDRSKVSSITGAFRPLGSVMTNKIKPDIKHTWTNVDYVFSPSLEKPYLDWHLREKKHHLFKGYKERDIFIGNPMFVMNTEELATLYHFPITTETTTVPSSIEKTESKKSQAPANLPIADL